MLSLNVTEYLSVRVVMNDKKSLSRRQETPIRKNLSVKAYRAFVDGNVSNGDWDVKPEGSKCGIQMKNKYFEPNAF